MRYGVAMYPDMPAQRDAWTSRYRDIRQRSMRLASPLSAEDQCVQAMPDASPTKWHLAHTTWFFETVVLLGHAPGYQVFHPQYAHLFNSYYESLGHRHPRPMRGVLTRPSLNEVHGYREAVDEAMHAFISGCPDNIWHNVAPLIELGLHHEQQHQELLLTDILYTLSLNPMHPAYSEQAPALPSCPPAAQQGWLHHTGGDITVGHMADRGFAFDNETPAHTVRLQPFAIASQLVSNRDYLAFMQDGGYQRPDGWLSDGWSHVQANGWQAPLYWAMQQGKPVGQFTLQGMQAWQADAPVCHLSFYEAAAYAQWAGARLPTEFEWETAAQTWASEGSGWLGQVWQWTRSSYDPYPRFKPLAGSVGEYNGKFMVGQLVLRGSSLATPPGHERLSYRNFFPPATRWQFAGLRLAKDL
jgi:ergothioneine biosynthesis protein EgtB